jgi:hypothetical protein
MSHFTVMVIGDNPEEQLAPYDENIQTAPRDKGEVSEEDKQRMIDHYKEPENGGLDLPFDELYALKGEDWDGNSLVKHEDGTWHEYSTYNPDSKWDWYQLGGRWADFLKLKSGVDGIKGEPSLLDEDFKPEEGRADAALKKDIDFDGMRDEDGEKAGKRWDKVNELLKDLPVNESWETIRRRHTKDDTDFSNMDAARAEYGAQPRVQAFNKNHEFGFFASPEDYNISREQYVQNARNGAVSTFALLKDGVWYEKGKMGWWACVSDEKEQDVWDKQVSDMLDALPDDTLISIYDCHI